MNKEDPFRDQAEKLRQRIHRKSFDEFLDKEQLPPRSNVHRKKTQKNKWKLKYPIIRLLVLFFILLPITILSIYYLLAEGDLGNTETKTGGSGGFEVIDIENHFRLQYDPAVKVAPHEDRFPNLVA